MQKDKSQVGSFRVAARHNAEPESSSQGKPTRSLAGAELGTLGSRGRKTGATLKESRANITNAATAKKWLAKEELLIDGEEITSSSLAQALLWLAAGDKSTIEQLVDGIRAVALCLEGCSSGELVDTAIVEIKETAATWVEEAKKVIHKAAEEIVEAAKKKVDEGGRRSWADQVDEHVQEADMGATRAVPSYAQMVTTEPRRNTGGVKINYDHTVREALKRRRVLIEGVEGIRNAAGGLTPAEIVQKANIALTAARIDTEGWGIETEVDPKAIAAKVLENGGVVLELETEEAAVWVMDAAVRKVFESNFGGSAKLVDKLFSVVACFVPVTFRDTLADTLSKIEDDNNVAKGTIVKCKWLKAPKYWSQNQRFAHAVLSVSERLDACTMIQQGIIIEGHRYQAKKLEELPKRCFKCQRIGHMASKCIEIHEVCPFCAGAHAGDQCKVSPDSYRCINCTKAKRPANHAVWDRACPSMFEEKKKRDLRNPDSQYKYFPTKEEWTWTRRQGDEEGETESRAGKVGLGQTRGPFMRQADKGWEGMRETRTMGDVVGDVVGWQTAGPRRTAQQANNRPASRVRGPSQIATGSNVTLSQVQAQTNTQESAARSKSVPRGRQSRLGDYWSGNMGTQGEEEDESDGRQVTNILNDNLC